MRKCSKKIKDKTHFNEKVLKKIKDKTYFNEKVFKKETFDQSRH